MNSEFPILIHEEVKDSLSESRAIVALESTVIAHGLPSPVNIDTTRAMIQAVREQGAIPALIAIIDGVVRVGITSAELERLADDKAPVRKVSRRDIAFTMATKATGATTVSATMAIAARAGIRLFATGGIGGVHRGAATSMDISADIFELAHTPVAVICAGAKSILDVPKTLELLESYGVPVIGFGTDYFPEFYSLSTTHRLCMRCNNAHELSELIKLHLSLKKSGLVIAQPIDEARALPHALIESHIAEALKKAERAQVCGKDLTPFLLQAIAQSTNELSIAANSALLINNAALAGSIGRIMAEYFVTLKIGGQKILKPSGVMPPSSA